MSNERISFKEKFSYGLGDFSCNMLFTLLGSYLMFFYTDVAGIGLASVGIIMLVARIVDAVTDPIMGGIIDKTNTRWGKARPYILFTAIPFGVISVLTFCSPDLSQNGKFIYALITYVLFCVMYTALNIPYTTMLCSITDNENDRLSFNMFKSVLSNVGAFIASGSTLALVAFFGKGNQETGFTYTVAFYAFIAIVLLLICFKNTKERVYPIEEKISFKDSIKVAIKNKPWIVLCIIQFLSFTALFVKNQSTMYYVKYYIGNESLGPILMSISGLVAVPVALVVPKLAKKFGKRNCIIIGQVLQIIGLVLTYLAKSNEPVIIAAAVVSAAGFGICISITFVMAAETVDYSEWKTGLRPQGILMALIGFMVKLGMAVAGVLSAQILSMGGYVAGAVQSASAISAIVASYIWVPVAIATIIIVVSLFYTLDKEYDTVISDLQKRRNAA